MGYLPYQLVNAGFLNHQQYVSLPFQRNPPKVSFPGHFSEWETPPYPVERLDREPGSGWDPGGSENDLSSPVGPMYYGTQILNDYLERQVPHSFRQLYP